MIRVLQFGLSRYLGGIEANLLRFVEHMDRNSIHVDFLVFGEGEPIYYHELRALGCEFIYVHSSRILNHGKYKQEIRKAITDGNYDLIHCNLNSMSPFETAYIASRLGKPVILHSHNANCVYSLKTRALHKLGKLMLSGGNYTRIAVSEEAGRYMFGDHPFRVIGNGVDVDRFRYDEKARNELRNELHIGDREAIIHIGAFRSQKNHAFLIRTFLEYLKIRPDSVLLLVGDGELESGLKEMVRDQGIADKVMFLGRRDDVPELLSAADKFCFPSKYEGFGNAVCEAEASGLICVASDEIPAPVAVGDLCVRLPLSLGPREWAEVLASAGHVHPRTECGQMVTAAGLDVDTEMEKLRACYAEALGDTQK